MSATFSQAPLWYLTRSTGIVAFVLLTVTTALGIASSRRAVASRLWPRFATQQLHRNASLLAVVALVVHIVSTLADSFVHVGWAAFVVPFASPYHRLGVGLGTAAFDLLLAIIASSLLRARLPLKAWRALHLTAYAAWPLALLHFLSAGTDARSGHWGVWLAAGCAASVAAAAAVRLTTSNPIRPLPSLARSAR